MPLVRALISLLACQCLAQQIAVQTSGTTESLRGISVLAHHVAWASGTHGTYLRTLNGGQHWTSAQVPGAESLDFRDVEAFSADLAYLLAAGPGDQSRIYKTTDGGQHWTLQFTNVEPKGFFDCISFWDATHGIAIGDPVNGKFELISTEDGGLHWTSIPSDHLPPAIAGEGAFAASGTCIATQGKSNVWFATGGKAARVFRSSDRGQTWAAADTPITHGPDSAGIFSIAFRDAKHGVISGGDYKHPEQGGANVAFTNDGGLTWKLSKLLPQSYFFAISFKKHSLLAAGTLHAAYASDPTNNIWTKSWDLNLNALSADKYGNAIAVGQKGIIVSFQDLH